MMDMHENGQIDYLPLVPPIFVRIGKGDFPGAAHQVFQVLKDYDSCEYTCCQTL